MQKDLFIKSTHPFFSNLICQPTEASKTFNDQGPRLIAKKCYVAFLAVNHLEQMLNMVPKNLYKHVDSNSCQ